MVYLPIVGNASTAWIDGYQCNRSNVASPCIYLTMHLQFIMVRRRPHMWYRGPAYVLVGTRAGQGRPARGARIVWRYHRSRGTTDRPILPFTRSYDTSKECDRSATNSLLQILLNESRGTNITIISTPLNNVRKFVRKLEIKMPPANLEIERLDERTHKLMFQKCMNRGIRKLKINRPPCHICFFG